MPHPFSTCLSTERRGSITRHNPTHVGLIHGHHISSENLTQLHTQLIKSLERRGGEKRTGFGGPAVSSQYQEEMVREQDKNIFDYCRENNIEHVSKAISSKKLDVNTKDKEGRALLRWACDRGHKDSTAVLLNSRVNINLSIFTLCLSQDDEGQTALHYASACEFADIAELLLKAGADPSIKDQEGSLPEEVTESSAISSVLHQ
ncbi:acyl-CoA-binding domain-containing protein 6-like [Xyrauchen texanus]|uniref:acyl-CoA-binding domain-containing protein 6-like n=1 Tax=Xyrauchen texanus TaxID=154827 RepID=UPI002242953E|nr:acyl-CoA-binding domain-containing protein 6-like [Xyrauchen texanus]